MARIIAVVFAFVASAAYARMAYELPAGAEDIVSNIQTTFSCDNRPYGYYADVDNECKIFHVCQPINNEAGELLETAHFSFLCGNMTIFNQLSLTCVMPEDSLPCEEAPSVYEFVNADFGKIPEQN